MDERQDEVFGCLVLFYTGGEEGRRVERGGGWKERRREGEGGKGRESSFLFVFAPPRPLLIATVLMPLCIRTVVVIFQN